MQACESLLGALMRRTCFHAGTSLCGKDHLCRSSATLQASSPCTIAVGTHLSLCSNPTSALKVWNSEEQQGNSRGTKHECVLKGSSGLT